MPTDAVSKLLFMIFIYVTDIERDITPDEVQHFNGLIGNAKWAKHPMLRGALGSLRAGCTSLWAAYDADTMPITFASVSAEIESLFLGLPVDEAAGLSAALTEFVQKFHQPGTLALSRSGLATSSSARLRAKGEIEELLDREARGPAGPVLRAGPHGEAVKPQGPAIAVDLPRVESGFGIWAAAQAASAGSTVWRGGRTPVRCVSVVSETADVKTYTFAAQTPCLFVYKPGQFVTLELPVDGRLLRRSYTLSSSPTRPHTLSITVKRVPKGWVSNWLHETMCEGFAFDLTGPHGDFTCLDHPSAKLLLLSGGSGVTPMMSMLRFLSDAASPADIAFVTNVRTPDDVVFERELLHIATRLGPALKLRIVPSRVMPGRAWNGLTGVLDEASLRAMVPDFMEREIFVCGPPGYMRMVRGLLDRFGYDLRRHHEESFGRAALATPTAKPVPAIASAANPERLVAMPRERLQEWEVVFKQSRKTVFCTAGDRILDIAESHGIALPSSCRSGVCGTCKIHKEGDVFMDGQQVLNEQDIRDGYVLACVAEPRGHIVVNA